MQRFRIGSGPISALAAATGGQVRRRGIPIDEEVRAEDVGRGEVPVESTMEVVDLLTIRLEPRSRSAAEMVVEWDRTRVRVPIVLSEPGGSGYR